jgi:choline dehydrogenase-like flavoprotein
MWVSSTPSSRAAHLFPGHQTSRDLRHGAHESAVVDPSLCVYGTTNLRVANASIMPTVTSGNSNAPTIVIAERAAQMIKGYQIRLRANLTKSAARLGYDNSGFRF